MVKHLKKTAILLTVFTVSHIAQAQLKQNSENVRHSADRTNSVKDGLISPDLYTGTLSLSIPFYTYRDNDFEIPVSFDYASSGFVANERAGVLGHGWNLNAGGCITREIKGIPDERLNFNNLHGFYALHKSGINQEPLNTMLSKLFRIFGYYGIFSNSATNTVPAVVYCTDGNIMSNAVKYDAEPDIFHFSFSGYSGTFHLGFNNTIHVYNTNINSKGLRVEITGSNSSDRAFAAINIHTPDGYKYVFDCNPQSKSIEWAQTIAADAVPNADDKGEAVAWSLTKIVAPNGREINFEYEQCKIISYRPATFKSEGNCLAMLYKLTGNTPDIQTSAINNPLNGSEHVFYQNVLHVPILKVIDTDMLISMEFGYTEQTQNSDMYYMFGPMRGFADMNVKLANISVIYWHGGGKGLKQCNLSYKYNKNGARNCYLDFINISGEGKYSMDYHKWNDGIVNYAANGTFSVDHWGYYNGKNNLANTACSFLNVSNLNSNLDEILASTDRNADANYAVCGMLSKLTYPAGGYSQFEYEAHDYSKAVKRMSGNNFLPSLTNETGICGGLRIKSVKNYLNSNTVMDTKEFEYRDGNRSSGILLNSPKYIANYSASLSSRFNENNITIRSSSLLPLGRTHIEYSRVTEILSDSSKTEYSYTNSQMPGYMDTVIYTCAGEKIYYRGQYYSWAVQNHSTVNNMVAPYISKQFIRGKLFRQDVFKSVSDQTPLFSVTNGYSNSYSDSLTYVPAYFVHSFGYVPVFTGSHNISSSAQVQYFDNGETCKTTVYTYNSYGQISAVTAENSKKNMQTVEYRYVTDTLNTNGLFADMMLHNLTGSILSEKIYIQKNGIKIPVGGKYYEYRQPDPNKPALVRIFKEYSYNPKENQWETDIVNTYDSCGNLIETEDGNGIKTTYIWGHNGLHIVAECRNVSVEQIERLTSLNIRLKPLPGNLGYQFAGSLPQSGIRLFEYDDNHLVKVTDASGNITGYGYDDNEYHLHNKNMKIITDGKGNVLKKYYYHIAE